MSRKFDLANLYIAARNADRLKKIEKAQEEAARRNRKELEQIRKSTERREALVRQEIRKSTERREALVREEKRERDRQKSLRQWLSDLTESAESVLKIEDTVLRCQNLDALNHLAQKVHSGDFEDFQFQQHFVETKARIKEAFLNAANELGQVNIDLLAGFNVQLPVIKQEAIRLTQARAETGKGLPSDDDIGDWKRGVEKLESLVSELRKLDELADRVHLDQHPDYEFVRIAENFRHWVNNDLFLLKAATLIIKADKQVSRTEQLAFDQLHRRLLVSADEAMAIFESTQQIKPKEFSGNEKDAETLVVALSNMAFSDGELHKRELSILTAISKALGISESKLNQLVESAAVNPANRSFDGNKLIQAISAAGFRDMKNVAFGDVITQKSLEQVGFTDAMPDEGNEFPVACYSKKSLGITISTILVTDHRLFLVVAASPPVEPINLVDIVAIEEFGSALARKLAVRTSQRTLDVPIYLKEFLMALKGVLPQFNRPE